MFSILKVPLDFKERWRSKTE